MCEILCIFSGSTSYLLYLTKGYKFQDSVIQALHCLWSLGATISPFITRNFLSSRNYADIQDNYAENVTMNFTFKYDLTSAGSNVTMVTLQVHEDEEPIIVQYAFLTVGLVGLLISLPMWIMIYYSPRKIIVRQRYINHTEHKRDKKQNIKQSKKSLIFHLGLLTMAFFWFYFYLWVEALPGQFLATWSIRALKWKKSDGPLLTSAFYGSHSIGRLIGVALSAAFSPRKILLWNMSLTAISYIILLTLHQIHPLVTWISVPAAGLGMACSFGAMCLWISRHMTVTGAVSAVLLIGSSAGVMSGPPLVGFLVQEYSPDWFLYLILTGALLDIVLYILMELYVKVFKRMKTENKTIEKEMTDLLKQ